MLQSADRSATPVEYMRVAAGHAHANRVAGAGLAHSGHTHRHRSVAAVHREIGDRLVAETLDHIDPAFEEFACIIAEREMLRADTELDAVAFASLDGPAELDPSAGQVEDCPPLRRSDPRREEIHPRRTDELCDEPVLRRVVQVHWRAHLLDAPGVEDDDPVRERHRLHLVVRHIDHGRPDLLVQTCNLEAHLHAQRRVEVRQRLIEQEHVRIADDRPADRDALPLAAGQLLGAALEERRDLQDFRYLRHTAAHLILAGAGEPETERDVVGHRHVRKERVGLEDHGDATPSRRDSGHVASADANRAARHAFEPRDHSQQRRLPAARRPDEDDELAGPDLKVDALDRLDGTERLVNARKAQSGHFCNFSVQPLTAPMVMPLMNQRWKNRKTRSVGRLATSDSAP